MLYFRDDNTEGYTAADLLILNAAWTSLGVSILDDDEPAAKSIQDHVAARLLADFDRGLRGADLVAAYYEEEG